MVVPPAAVVTYNGTDSGPSAARVTMTIVVGVLLMRFAPKAQSDTKIGSARFFPVIVTVCPPATGPRFGLMLSTIGGPVCTVSVKGCEAFGTIELPAVNVIGKSPIAVGVPFNWPSVVSKVIPAGRLPVSVKVVTGG